MEHPPQILLDGPGYELIVHEFGGRTFKASRRTFAHLWDTQRRLSNRKPGARLCVIQPSYNQGVPESAGTHDYDAVLDVEIVGWDDWWAEQRFLRECGWADWVRFPPAFGWHHHMISLGYTTRVGEFVPGQVDDYYRHALGLKGQHDSGSDDTWHPANINATIFEFPKWRTYQEDHMPLNAEDKDFIRRAAADAANDAVAKLLDADVSPEKGDNGEVISVRVALRRAASTPDIIRKARDAVLAKFPTSTTTTKG